MARKPDRRLTRAWLLALAFGLALGLGWRLSLPPWSAPDEPGHYLYTRLLADLGRRPLPADLGPAVEAPLLRSLSEQGWWDYLAHPVPDPLPSRLSADPLLAASGLQIADEPLLFYIFPAFALRHFPASIARDPAQSLTWLRLWPLALRLGAGLAALWLAGRWWPRRPDRVLGLGLLVGGLPMVAFIGGSLNNDALALLWGTLAFALLALPGPFSRRRLLVAAGVVITGPIWVDAGLLYLWPLALARLSWNHPRARLAWIGAAAVALLLLLPVSRWAAGWRRQPAFALTRSGQSLAANPSPGQTTRLIQHIGGRQALALRNHPLELSVADQGPDLVGLTLAIADNSHTASRACSLLLPCRLGFTPAGGASFLRIEVTVDRPSRFRLHLRDESGRTLLFDGDGALPDRLGSPLFAYLERRLPIPAGYFAQALAPAAWDAPSQFRYLLFGGFTWASFWGWFGWLSRPLPWPLYLLLAAATLAAGWGLFRLLFPALFPAGPPTGAPSPVGRPGENDENDGFLLRFSLIALTLLLAQVWLPMAGQSWQPQGRYLLPGLAPIGILLLLGWEELLPPTWRSRFPLILASGLGALNLLAWYVVARR